MEENLLDNVIFKLSPKGGKRINYVKNQCKGFTGRGRAYAKTLRQERAHFVQTLQEDQSDQSSKPEQENNRQGRSLRTGISGPDSFVQPTHSHSSMRNARNLREAAEHVRTVKYEGNFRLDLFQIFPRIALASKYSKGNGVGALRIKTPRRYLGSHIPG